MRQNAECIKKTEDIEKKERKISDEDFAGLKLVTTVMRLFQKCFAALVWSGCTDGHCSTPAAVLRELCLVRMCVPGVSLERHAAGILLGMQEGEGIEGCSGFMSQSGKLQECLSRLK